MAQTRRRNRFQPDFSPLEDRQLMAAGVGVGVHQGVLFIEGTEFVDRIAVAIQPAARPRTGTVATVTVDGVRRVTNAAVHTIAIVGKGGNDTIAISGRATLGCIINAGEGNDTVTGGLGNDIIVGEDGDDVLRGGGGQDFIDGGAGIDTINGVRETPPPPPVDTTFAALVTETVRLTNVSRQLNGLPNLNVNAKLTQAAQIQANNMALLDKMEHDLPGVAQPTLLSRIQYVGYNFSYAGENIAYNYTTAASVTDGWFSSPGHRANILFSQFTEIGVAVARNSRGQLYFAQVFARPA